MWHWLFCNIAIFYWKRQILGNNIYIITNTYITFLILKSFIIIINTFIIVASSRELFASVQSVCLAINKKDSPLICKTSNRKIVTFFWQNLKNTVGQKTNRPRTFLLNTVTWRIVKETSSCSTHFSTNCIFL